jgi:hypothetical protein
LTSEENKGPLRLSREGTIAFTDDNPLKRQETFKDSDNSLSNKNLNVPFMRSLTSHTPYKHKTLDRSYTGMEEESFKTEDD